MSYAYALSERARVGLAKMEIWLKEETLDELDRIAAGPRIQGRRIGEAVVCDFVRDRGTQPAYVFLTMFPDDRALILRVRDIGFCVLPHDPEK